MFIAFPLCDFLMLESWTFGQAPALNHARQTPHGLTASFDHTPNTSPGRLHWPAPWLRHPGPCQLKTLVARHRWSLSSRSGPSGGSGRGAWALLFKPVTPSRVEVAGVANVPSHSHLSACWVRGGIVTSQSASSAPKGSKSRGRQHE
ncbi:hypothetical protein EDB19DRAFT_2024686 [Suillus lakei]|nr:hypothetical protein EDB19DRAFT_2024686 [Suillus lakei]